MLRVGIIGATGYTGEELVKILIRHPNVKITYLAAKLDKPQGISSIFPYLAGNIRLICDNLDMDKAINLSDLLFLALPHTVSMQMVPKFLKAGKRIIDLSADYRIKDVLVYKKWYKITHKDKKNLFQAVYGLPEFYRQEVKNSKLVANPGCYPTAAILGLAPILVSELGISDSIIIDAKAGLTGAGRKANLGFLFAEVDEDVRPYKINTHQHIPEINVLLSKFTKAKVRIAFIPQTVPLKRGILETIYIRLHKHTTDSQLINLYKKFYKNEPFIRIRKEGVTSSIKDVVGTNFCDIGVKFVKENRLLIIVVCIDNLLKGAAGQAVQNMNIMYNFKETAGLL